MKKDLHTQVSVLFEPERTSHDQHTENRAWEEWRLRQTKEEANHEQCFLVRYSGRRGR